MNEDPRSTAIIEHELRTTVPRPQPPAGLADRISRSIRFAPQPAHIATSWSLWRWLPAPAFALIIVLAVWGLQVHRTPSPAASDLARAREALTFGQTPNLPLSVVAPLESEWNNVNQDLDKTAEFLLASLP